MSSSCLWSGIRVRCCVCVQYARGSLTERFVELSAACGEVQVGADNVDKELTT